MCSEHFKTATVSDCENAWERTWCSQMPEFKRKDFDVTEQLWHLICINSLCQRKRPMKQRKLIHVFHSVDIIREARLTVNDLAMLRLLIRRCIQNPVVLITFRIFSFPITAQQVKTEDLHSLLGARELDSHCRFLIVFLQSFLIIGWEENERFCCIERLVCQ